MGGLEQGVGSPCTTVIFPLFSASDANGNQNRQPSEANGGGGGGEEPSSFASMMFSKDAPKIEPRILNLIPLKPDHPPTPPMPHNAAKGTPPRGRILSIDVRLLLQWTGNRAYALNTSQATPQSSCLSCMG